LVPERPACSLSPKVFVQQASLSFYYNASKTALIGCEKEINSLVHGTSARFSQNISKPETSTKISE